MRERYLRAQGWRVVRFTADNVELDAEAVAIEIFRHLGKEYEFNNENELALG